MRASKLVWVVVLLLSAPLSGCKKDGLAPADEPIPQPRNETQTRGPATMPEPVESLEQQLLDRKFGEYFYYPAYETTLAKIWDAQPGPERLQALIADGKAATLARLIAAEVLYEVDILHLQGAGMKNVAEVYAKALVEDVTGFANSWGLLWENDDMGPQGTHLRMCGKSANPFLIPLLDDDTVRANYVGSEEATVGNAAGFRVKDFAAYYLSKINNIPLPYHRDVATRDAAIEGLRQALPR